MMTEDQIRKTDVINMYGKEASEQRTVATANIESKNSIDV